MIEIYMEDTNCFDEELLTNFDVSIDDNGVIQMYIDSPKFKYLEYTEYTISTEGKSVLGLSFTRYEDHYEPDCGALVASFDFRLTNLEHNEKYEVIITPLKWSYEIMLIPKQLLNPDCKRKMEVEITLPPEKA